jgi:hypothetical protein
MTETNPIIKTVRVTEERQMDYEKQRKALMVPDPWTDPFCAKNGLINIYIESTIAEIMYLRSESEPGAINCPNPVYAKYHTMLNNCLETRNNDQIDRASRFKDLLKFLENEVPTPGMEIVKWIGYIPDIRLVDNLGEALGWLAQHLSIDLPV